MSKKVGYKKVLVASLSIFMSVSLVQMPLAVQADSASERAVDGVTSIGKIASLSDITVSDNVVNIATTNNGEKIRLTFVNDDVFRLNVEPKGNFVEEPATSNANYVAKMLVKPISEYEGVTPIVTEDESNYIVATKNLTLMISKADSKMKMINNENQQVVWSEKAPLEYGNGKTRQTLNEDQKENFYGGGFQNGYFSHKNTSIQINDVAPNGNWGDGMVSSPAPFYMSTNGYGVMRYTWKNGVYDFGSDDPTTTVTSHNEERFDAIYFLGDMPKVIDEYTDLTGKPVMLPEYSYYLGHANCYNRDYWVEDTNGTYEFDGKRYRETGSSNPGGNAFRETLNDSPVSARKVIDWYQKKDMPLGWFLPNDGYGCGYGQSDRGQVAGQADAVGIDDNIENLRQFTEYANDKGVEVGLWTQSDLVPREYAANGDFNPVHLRRDVKKEVNTAGVRAIKTDVAWVGEGFSMALNSVKTAADTIEGAGARPFVVSLFGWNGTQRYSTIWSGDQSGAKWEYIRFHIPSYIGSGLSGQPYVGSDMDGIHGGGKPIIQTRDYQWKAFTPVQIDMDGWGSTIKNPDAFKGEYSSINRMYLKTKAEMIPYIYSNTYEANKTGMPLIRAMVLEYPDDPFTYGTETKYQYMWGKNLLVAPIYQDTASDANGNDIRNGIYLPDEDQIWIDYFTGEQYQGGKVINNFAAPIWKLPVFVKNGAIIPMAENNNSPTELKGASPRIFEVWPSGDTDFTLFEDDGISTEYYNGSYATTNITSSAPKTGDGTAVIKVEAANTNKQDYASVTKYDQVRDTQFVVNVQKEPTSITAIAGNKNITYKAVSSQEEFDQAKENVYFYNETPNMNKYNQDGETFAKTEVITTPKVYVKTVDVDVMQDLTLTVDGFNNTQGIKEDGKTEAPAVPTGLHAPEDTLGDTSIRIAWNAVEGDTNGASYYEVRINGEEGYIQSNINKTEYLHEDLKQDSEYMYEVRAVNSAGASAWSEPITVKTLLDRYRNVIPELSIATPNSADGNNANVLINRDILDTWYSKFDNSDASVAIGEKTFDLDFKEVYNLDKIELYGVEGFQSGNPSDITIEASIDGIHYKKVLEHFKPEWKNKQLEAIIPLDGASMRYARITVHQPYNQWIALSEIMPYKVDGSKSSEVGDVNGDRVVDEGDLSFLNNYAGINSSDVLWASQVSQADFNGNDLIDGYDLAFVASAIYGKGSSQQKVAGNIIAIPSKTNVSKGEEIEISILGVNLNDVNAFSFELSSANNHFTVNEPAMPSKEVNHMIKYPRSFGSRVTLAVSNYGYYGDKLNGTMKLATVKAIANEDTTFDMELTNALVIGPAMMEKNAIGSIVAPDADFPEIDTSYKQLVNGVDFAISSTTPEKFQSGCGPDKAADGDMNSLSELMWGAGAEMPLNWTFDLTSEKEVNEITVYKRANANGSLKKMEMKAYYQGAIVYEEIRDNIENGAGSTTFKFDKPIMVDKVEFNALDSHQASESTKYMTIREIVINGRNNSAVTDIEPDAANVYTVQPDSPFMFKANITPSNATNKYYTVKVSNPDLVKVSRMQDDSTGDISYILTAGQVSEDTKVTVTATSLDNNSIFFEKEITISASQTNVNKEALKAVMDEAKGLLDKEDLYTVDYIAELRNAYDEANVIYNASNATQTEVTMATAKLKTLVQNPILKEETTFMKGILLNVITKAQNAAASPEFEKLAPAVKENITNALGEAQTVYDKVDATNAEILTVWNKLASSLHYLDFKADKTTLLALIVECDAIQTDDYQSGVQEFKDALQNAHAVADDETALQLRIDDAHARLLAAKLGLGKDTVNKALLNQLITIAQTAKEHADQYNQDENWTAMINALDEAIAINTNTNATQSEVSAASAKLAAAYENIRLIPDEALIQQLKDFVNVARALNAKDYPADVYADIMKIADDADAMLLSSNYPQGLLTSLLENINTAYQLIENGKAETPQAPDATPEDKTETPSNPDQTVEPSGTTKPGTTKTGDVTNTAGLFTLLGGAGFTAFFAKKKNKKNKK